MDLISFVIALVAFALVAPFLGGLIKGADRIITARIQDRVGPPLLQPFYDVQKLWAKQSKPVNDFIGFYVLMSLIFAILAGAFFFAGGNFLMVVFVLTLSALFFVLAAFSARSPYADAGASREIIQVAAYEPLVILMAVAFYLASHSFNISVSATLEKPLICEIPLIFLALLFVLTIKLRKSPFDLSVATEAHQELVKGAITEFSGRTLALYEVMEWYESVLFLGWVGLFFVFSAGWSWFLALGCVIVVYFLEIMIDNNFARVKWQAMFKWSWLVTLVLGFINLFALYWI
ncbi:MAG: NADH-quinone oxidoreductase subunit H [Coriobacteriales bacterium]|jgi:ech hydrogenase subunit B|nr:NADH-quinone oxidoreductase subunit H [Coriobacteriales bacterium]